MQELGIPELTSKQIEELCLTTEEGARKYALSKVPSKKIEALDISVEAEGTRPVTLKIQMDVALSPSMKDLNVRELVDGAIKEAFNSAEKYLRELTCRSRR